MSAAELEARIDPRRLPRHVAIIMDGNGRWARSRGLPRVAGHRAGVGAVKKTVETCARLQIEDLTLYAFSLENWQRPAEEVGALMSLLELYIERELATLRNNGIRFGQLGRTEGLPAGVQRKIAAATADTAACTRMRLNVAVNYGGRAELVDACRALAAQVQAGTCTPEQIDEAAINNHLYTAGAPDPDLLIRTSGERRVSNFLLWQLAYAEIYITDVLWPDFGPADLFRAIIDYQGRDRRFGKVSE